VTRPALVVVVSGTGTEVGKTWLAAGLLAELRQRGFSVSARKPVQSYAPGEPTDAEILARASAETATAVCPAHRWYPIPLAPPIAARVLRQPPPTLSDLVDELERGWPSPPVDIGVVEGAGGVASPLAIDGDTAALARRIGAGLVVLVGEAQLGIINSVRLSHLALQPLPVAVYLNRYEPAGSLQEQSRHWLTRMDHFAVSSTLAELSDAVVAATRQSPVA
jgi:dethiobiotin synthetase